LERHIQDNDILFLSIICAQSGTRSFCSLSLLHGYRVACCKLLQDKKIKHAEPPLVCTVTVSRSYLPTNPETHRLKTPLACTTRRNPDL